MTHAEALESNRIGLLPSACPGELVPMGRYEDWYLAGRDDLTRPVMACREVVVLRCVACGTWIPMADGRPLNAYGHPPEPPDPGRMVAELAAAMDGRGNCPDEVP